MTFFKNLRDKLTGKPSQFSQITINGETIDISYLDTVKKIEEKIKETNLLSPDYVGRVPEAELLPPPKKEYTEEYLRSLFENAPGKYFAVNTGILEVLASEKIDLKGHDWREFFSIVFIERCFEIKKELTYIVSFPLFNKFVANKEGVESPLALEWKTVDPGFWQVPGECFEPIENMKDPDILLKL